MKQASGILFGLAAMLFGIGMTLHAHAAPSGSGQESLYAAATPVANQSAQERDKAFKRDLAQVLVKVSGNPNAAQVAALSNVLSNAGNLVVEYRYRAVPVSQGGGQELWAHFDAKAVDKALIQSGQGTWGKGRPTVVAWVLNGGSIVADNPNAPIVSAMTKNANKRGLPLVIPLMDLTDQKRVSGFDIRTLFLPALQSASQRYGAHAMLIGVINSADVGVQSQWTLVFDNNSTSFQETADTPQQAAAEAVGHTTTLLAQQLAYLPAVGGGGQMRVVVSGVNSLANLKRVESLIMAVPGVGSLQLDSLRGSLVGFQVPYAGAVADLQQALTVAGSLSLAPSSATTLSPVAATGTGPSRIPVIHLRYTP